MGETDDQVLRLRLEALKTNLEQVRDIKASVASRRKEIHDLLPVFDAQEGIQEIAELLRGTLEMCRKWAEQISHAEAVPRTVAERLHSRLKEAEQDAGTIAANADTSARIIKAMGRRWSSIPSDSFDRHIDEIFAHQAKVLIDQIDSLRNKALPGFPWVRVT
jgi:DNA repair ATPase RecN